ncbi:MAG: cupredoxin domain-containing protein [Iamia sp.]
MRLRGLAPVAVLLFAAAGCGADEVAGPPGSGGADEATETTVAGPDLSDVEFADETGAATVEVDAVDNDFREDYIEIDPGTTIRFRNDGRNVHNILPVQPGSMPEVPTEAFEPGAEAELTFDEPAEIAFYCSLHGTTTKGMVGGVRVVG